MILHTPSDSYFSSALSVFSAGRILWWSVQQIRESEIDFDAIVVCGVSGLVVGPMVANALGVPLVVVRKEDDHSTHSDFQVEGCIPERYIIIDDFIESGDTVQYIQGMMDEHANEHGFEDSCECVSTLMYESRKFYIL